MVDDRTLARLRELVAQVRQDGRTLDRRTLVALAGELELEAGLTIDLDAIEQLGQAMVVLRAPERRAGSDPCFAELTERERQVAELVATGLRNADVALALGISVATVKDHVHRILTKSGLDGRSGIAASW